ncbi:hypothetical protein NL676_012524 [Syzygium grande]|nr:hypothetical protein NL676_012524 [Syzygium grande]
MATNPPPSSSSSSRPQLLSLYVDLRIGISSTPSELLVRNPNSLHNSKVILPPSLPFSVQCAIADGVVARPSSLFLKLGKKRLLVSSPYIDEMMDHKLDRRFGRGPRELCGAADLISRFRLQPYHDFFCKRALPISVSDTNYLNSVVGDREIRKGERLNSDQLSLTLPHVKKGGSQIHAFDLKVLWEAFEIRQAPSLCLFPGVERADAAVANSLSILKGNDLTSYINW